MRSICLLTLILAVFVPIVPAEEGFFPLHLGDQWTYEAQLPNGSTEENTRTVDRSARGDQWLHLDNFHGIPLWVDVQGDRVDSFRNRRVALLYDFSPAASMWRIVLSSACLTGTVTVGARDEIVETPAGVFTGCIRLDYRMNCLDAGLQSEWFAPGVGLVKYTTASLLGEVEHLLVRAVIDGQVVPDPSASEEGVNAQLNLDRYTYWINMMPVVGDPHPPTMIDARLVLKNRSGEDIDLDFSSSQVFDIVLRDASGREIWRWSANKLFLRVLVHRTVADGQDFIVSEKVSTRIQGFDLPEGDYSLEFFLVSDQRFGGTASLRIRHAH